MNRRIRLSVGIVLLALALGLVLGRCPCDVADSLNVSSVSALLLIICGLGLRSWAAGCLRKGQALTTTGPYQLCRHPLYLGTLLLITGIAVIFPGILPSLPSLGLLVVLLRITLAREEQRMTEKYGSAWKEYAARTPCLLPLRLPTDLSGEWLLAQWVRSREYNAVVATVAVVAGLELWSAFLK